MKIVLEKDKLYDKYIVDNLTVLECAEYFNVGRKTIVRRLKEYGILKPISSRYENIKKAFVRKYGENYQCGFNEKAKKTMLERYGVKYTAQSPELLQKMQATMEERYGKKNYVETSEFQGKSSSTCINKYGVEWPCQYPQCIKALEEAIGHSKPEESFSKLLEGFDYEREFPIRGFKYDFKVGNILFEINPSSTHNVNFGLFGNNPKDKNYHYTKYSVAKEYGYRVVNVFDWDNSEKIVKK